MNGAPLKPPTRPAITAAVMGRARYVVELVVRLQPHFVVTGLGVSIPKGERWLVLGGHGRNGAG